jgi:tRNA U34 5-methylaminomethyl-2-thiouridine-forming methyltransferase MnmC
MTNTFTLKPATPNDVPLILSFIKELAEYEKLLHEVVATEEILKETLFGEKSHAEVVMGYLDFIIFQHS